MLLNKPLTRETTLENLPLGGLSPDRHHPPPFVVVMVVVVGGRLVTGYFVKLEKPTGRRFFFFFFFLYERRNLTKRQPRFYLVDDPFLERSQRARTNFAPCFHLFFFLFSSEETFLLTVRH